MQEEVRHQATTLWKLIKKYISLEVDYAKLTIAEKLTIFLSALATILICIVIGCFIILLLSFALVDYFNTLMSPVLSYILTASVLLIFMLLLIVFRKRLIINPISKFITKLFFNKGI